MKYVFILALMLVALPVYADPVPGEVEVGHLQSYLNPNNRDSIYVDPDLLLPSGSVNNVEFMNGMAGLLTGFAFLGAVMRGY